MVAREWRATWGKEEWQASCRSWRRKVVWRKKFYLRAFSGEFAGYFSRSSHILCSSSFVFATWASSVWVFMDWVWLNMSLISCLFRFGCFVISLISLINNWSVDCFFYLFNVLLDQSSHCSLLVLLMLFWICSASRVPLLLLLKINTSHYFCKLPGTFKMFLVPSGFWMWWTGNVKNSSYWTDHHLCPQLYPASSLFTYPLNPSLTTFAWPRMAMHGCILLIPRSCPFCARFFPSIFIPM